MSDRSKEAPLDLTVRERGLGVGSALPAFPVCCCLYLCTRGCCSSSSCGKEE